MPFLYTLIHNNGMSNVSSLFAEEKRRRPGEDTLTVVRGVVGAYPNAFYRVHRRDLREFSEFIKTMGSEEDYREFTGRFAVRRNDPRFWTHSDGVHAAYQALAPLSSALLDYNRLENR